MCLIAIVLLLDIHMSGLAIDPITEGFDMESAGLRGKFNLRQLSFWGTRSAFGVSSE